MSILAFLLLLQEIFARKNTLDNLHQGVVPFSDLNCERLIIADKNNCDKNIAISKLQNFKEVSKNSKINFFKSLIFNLKPKILFLIGSGSILLKFKGIFITVGTTTMMLVLNLICDVFPSFEFLYVFLLPLFSTLAIFQFITGYIDIFITNFLSFIKVGKNEIITPLLLMSLIIIVPIVLGFLFSEKERMVKSDYHHYFFILAALWIAIDFNLYHHGSSLLTSLSSNQNNGYFVKGLCFFMGGVLKVLKFIFRDSLNLICRIITFFSVVQFLHEINDSVLNFSKSKITIPS